MITAKGKAGKEAQLSSFEERIKQHYPVAKKGALQAFRYATCPTMSTIY